jgi:peroxiredoxin
MNRKLRFDRLLAALLVALPLWSGIAAAEPLEGAPFPHSLDAPDQSGKLRSLKSITGKKGVVLFFVRSADWCPFCKGQLVDVNRHLPGFRDLGFEPASVSVDDVAIITEFSQAQGIGYVMLSDPKGSINEALGIRDTQYPLGSAAFGVPKPTAYVIDAKGVVRLRYREPTFRTRPDLDAMIGDIRKLGL